MKVSLLGSKAAACTPQKKEIPVGPDLMSGKNRGQLLFRLRTVAVFDLQQALLQMNTWGGHDLFQIQVQRQMAQQPL